MEAEQVEPMGGGNLDPPAAQPSLSRIGAELKLVRRPALLVQESQTRGVAERGRGHVIHALAGFPVTPHSVGSESRLPFTLG